MKRPSLTRRRVLRRGLAAGVAVVAGTRNSQADPPASGRFAGPTASAPGADPPLPTRKLGRSGIEVSVLNLGTAFSLTQEILDYAYQRGVRYFDTADCYPDPAHIGGSERVIGEWFSRTGRRKEIFLVTKCHPRRGPEELPQLLDERLKVLRTDYVDLILMHAFKYSEYGKDSADWLRGGALRTVAEKIRRSGKARLVGFSSHDPEKSVYLRAAAEGGFIDACMVKYDPRSTKNDDMNRALDTAHKAGLGVVAMKTQSSADQFRDRWQQHHKGGLSVHQAVVKAVLSDERLAGMTSHMETRKIIDENTAAAREPKKLSAADRRLLMQLYADGPHRLCERCNGACAAAVGGRTELHDVARMVMYVESYRLSRSARSRARRLPANWWKVSDAELQAASAACKDGLDYAAIYQRARRYFGCA